MGIKVRHTAKEGTSLEVALVAGLTPSYVFEGGCIYDMHPLDARYLIKSLPEKFERASYDEPGYAEATKVNTPVVAVETPDVPEADLVALRSSISFKVKPTTGPEIIIDVEKNTDFHLPKAQAKELLEAMPGIVTESKDTEE